MTKKYHTQLRFGLYNVQPNPYADMVFFYFTPCLSIAMFDYCDQGGIYIGWLWLLLFIPFANNKYKRFEFYLLPMVSWARINGCQAIYLSWLFWKLIIPISNKQ